MGESAADMIARLSGVSREERRASLGGAIGSTANRVTRCNELSRILSLPRRNWAEGAEALAEQITTALRTPSGGMTLRPIQAAALREVFAVRGLFGPIAVGHGKTAITFLAPVVLDAKRPLVIVPAALRDKTEEEYADLRSHFVGPLYVRVESYEMLGRAQHADVLDTYLPDVVICDEVHKLANPKAAVSKRVRRYFSQWEDTDPARPVFVGLSGTITNRSLRDFADLQRLALAPRGLDFLPRDFETLATWAAALDSKRSRQRRPSPGALIDFCDDAQRSTFVTDPVGAAREGLRDRITSTPGVVATQGGKDYVESSLQLSTLATVTTPEIDQAFDLLREQWITPDGHPLADGIAVWRTARQLALGCYYVWDPRPPDEWLYPRRTWSAECREILKINRRQLDSELQVVNAIDSGHYPGAASALHEWRHVKESFVPNVRPVWLTDAPLRQIADWTATPPSRGGGKGAGLVWVEHRAVGEALARMTGLRHYGAKGRDAAGLPIRDHNPKRDGCAIASVASCGTGQNLQQFAHNLITCAPPSGRVHEQLLGRTHRPGQTADTVTATYMVGCYEDVNGLGQATTDARNIQQTTGADQKLVYADRVSWLTAVPAGKPQYDSPY